MKFQLSYVHNQKRKKSFDWMREQSVTPCYWQAMLFTSLKLTSLSDLSEAAPTEEYVCN